MDMKVGIRLLNLLPASRERALTARAIWERWIANGGVKVSRRTIQNYMTQLAADDGGGPPLLGVEKRGREHAYYLQTSQVASWFMTEEAALDLQLRRDVFGQALNTGNATAGEKLVDMAERVVATSPQTQRIRDRLHVAPDGIGRLPADVKPDVLRVALDAIRQDRQFKFTYKRSNGKASAELVSPMGLVAKDGTIYLVAVKSLSDSPRTFALHRVSDASVHFRRAQARPDFNLRQHVFDTHQLSHKLNPEEPPILLKLRVAPETMYHFEERPLSADQNDFGPQEPDKWHVVKATVPDTVLLVPFLLSMGPWIEVLGPKQVRDEMAKRIGPMHSHYAK